MPGVVHFCALSTVCSGVWDCFIFLVFLSKGLNVFSRVLEVFARDLRTSGKWPCLLFDKNTWETRRHVKPT